MRSDIRKRLAALEIPSKVTFPDIPLYAGWGRPLRVESDAVAMEVTRGEVPRELNGAWLRCGPDRQYPPRDGDDVFIDGEGQVHHPSYCDQAMPRNFGGQRPDGTTALSTSDCTAIHSHFLGQSSFAADTESLVEQIRAITGRGVNYTFNTPMLIRYRQQGRFPFDRLIRFYPFAEIGQAFADVASGQVIKPVLRIQSSY